MRFWLLKWLIWFVWRSESFIENTPHHRQNKPIFFEPISTTAIITSLIVSAAATGANLLISYLLRPKPKPSVQGKLTGDITLTDSILGAPFIEVFGARPADGSPGGVEVGCNVFYASPIRVIRTQVPASGSSGGGKGAPKPPPTIQYNYKIDCAAAAGTGPLRLLRMKFNQDIVFNNLSVYIPPGHDSRTYEAESGANTLGGTAVVAADTDCSGGQKVTGIGNGGTLTFTGVGENLLESLPDPSDDFPVPTSPFVYLEIYYKASSDRQAFVKLDGTGGVYSFPATAPGTVGVKSVTREYLAPPFAVEISNPSGTGPEIDKLVYSVMYLTRPLITGANDPNFPAELPGHNIQLYSPLEADTNPRERYNAPPSIESAEGIFSATLVGGAEMTWYPGTETQPVDAVIAAAIDAQYGAGSTPAFRETAYVRISNLDFTKYGSFPQIRMLVENMEQRTVEEICVSLALRSGLEEADVDFSAAGSKWIRGYYKNGVAAPARVMEDLALIHNLSFTETSDGQIVARNLTNRTPVATLTESDLGAHISDETEGNLPDRVSSEVPDTSEDEIRSLELQFNNPLAPADYNTDRAAYVYPFTASVRSEARQVNATLLPAEANKIIQLELQKHHLKSVPHSFSLTHRYAWLNASDCIEVPIDGELHRVRIEEKTGAAPGIYEISATSEEIFVLSNESVSNNFPPLPAPDAPANTVGTLMDLPHRSDIEGLTGGVYAGCCSRDEKSGVWSGAGLYRKKGTDDFELMTNFTKPCLIAVAVSALPDTLPGWNPDEEDTTNSVTIDIFGLETPSTLTAQQIADGLGDWCVGMEIIGIRTWTRDNDYPNRWTGTNLTRRRFNSSAASASSHAAGERVVLFSDAVKYIPLDETERNVERVWKFVTFGQRIEDAAPISFTWQGANKETLVPIIHAFQPATNTQIFFYVSNYTSLSQYRQIQWSLQPDFSAPTTILQDTFNEANMQLDPEVAITRSTNLANAETRHIRVRHSSNGINWGEWSNALANTYADSGGGGGSGGEEPPPTGGGGSGPCFTGEALLNFYDGRRINFRTVYRRQIIGEMALSFDKNGSRVPGRIKKLFKTTAKKWLYVEFADGESFSVKRKHRFKTERGEYVPICDIEIGERVRNSNGSFVALKVKEERRGRRRFYNAHIENWENYAVGETEKEVHNLKDINEV